MLDRRVLDVALGTPEALGTLAGVAGTCIPSLDAPDTSVAAAAVSRTCAPSLVVPDALVALATTAGVCSPLLNELLTCRCRRVTIFPRI